MVCVSDSIASEPEYLTIADLVELFGESPSRVRRLFEEHILAAVRIDGVLKVPALFIQDGEPLPSLRGTLLVLLDAGLSNDQSVEWLLEVNDELDARPIDLLRKGNKSAVRRATQALAF